MAVLYGSETGLVAEGNQLWHQDRPGIADRAHYLDLFGHALATGDFDADGHADLAIGVPNEETRDGVYSGAVHLLYGGPAGLSSQRAQFWTQDSPGLLDRAESNDGFGSALTSGDFDGDGVADLAVGVGHESIAGAEFAGAVHIMYGSTSGLRAEGNQVWMQDSVGVEGQSSDHEDFGWYALIAGDFDGNGFSDLGIGVTGEHVSGQDAAGSVTVLYGTADGLIGRGSQLWHQEIAGVADHPEFLDEFGFDLGTGDFDGDGFADLAVGVPSEGVAIPNQGAVHVLYGSPNGLATERAQFWHQDAAGVRDVGESGDMFGRSVLGGAWGGGTSDDLAIAATWEDVPSPRLGYEGVVHILPGGSEGLTGDADELWSQESPGVGERADDFDYFGSALA